jgi:hypothetical protein
MAQISCPWCSELTSIRRSRTRWQDYPRYLLGRRAYRCKICGNRFYGSIFARPVHAKAAPISKHP